MSSKVRSIQSKREQQEGIHVSLGQLISSVSQTPQLPGALDVLCSQQIPIAASFKLSKIVKAVSAELEQYNETRKKLCERYSNKDESGKVIMIETEGQPGRYDIPKDKLAEFEKELGELQATDVTLSGEQIKIASLGNVNLAPAYSLQLHWLLID